MPTPPTLDKILRQLGFSTDRKGQVWTRNCGPTSYAIRCSLGATPGGCKIDYGPEITLGRATTTSFAQPESAVVLDCVCRLLDQGFLPGQIILEQPYTVGHDPKYLDILVTRDGVAYLMIECKTAGSEFLAECARVSRNGGQVLTYFVQDRAAEWLVTYTRDFDGAGVTAQYQGLSTQGLVGSNTADLFESWDRELFESGLFECPPYTFQQPSLHVGELEDMQQEDGARIFNEFEEILRRHVVSDKPNAFNKIFNLFICKVFDEQKEDKDEELEFQWRNGETSQGAIGRLSDLYRQGVREFLHMEVADHSKSELEARLAVLTPENRDALVQMFTDLRLYKNNEFAFLDVYDERSFQQNAAIVRDVVRLLQKKRLRYSHKQPFLGDFFERLLNTSVKQESGQFFTPIPVARFVLDSLPIEQLVAAKIASLRSDFLPYIIDYASGSGHFLTEAMDRIDAILQPYAKPEDKRLTRKSQRARAEAWGKGYAWARDFVYGIERDYRLAKTAKVACFLNGDGEANVIRANGLASFRSEEYREAGGALPTKGKGRDNGNFDVVVANPPFSVRHCKRTIELGAESFELWENMSPTSSEIEVLFLERTKQLLKIGGVAGVIFPNSILQNGGLYRDARLLLLRNFEIVCLATLGSNAFMKTGIGTVVLFLRRRDPSVAASAAAAAARIVTGRAGSEDEPLEVKYATDVLDTGVSEYRAALCSPEITDILTFKEHVDAFEKSDQAAAFRRTRTYRNLDSAGQEEAISKQRQLFVANREQERVECFALAMGRDVIAVVPPSAKKDEEHFLGYRFSDRRGREGMMYLSGGQHIETPLFDPLDRDNPDKIASVIKNSFETGQVSIPSAIAPFCHVLSASELIDFTQAPFDVAIRSRPPLPTQVFAVPSEKLSVICEINIGGTPATNRPLYYRNGKHLWVSIAEMDGQVITSTAKRITDDAVANSNVKLVKAGTTLVSFKLSVGKTARAGCDLYTNEAIAALVPKGEWDERISQDYLFALFTLFGKVLMNVEGVGGKQLGTVMNKKMLGSLQKPILDPAGQKTFVEVFARRSSVVAAAKELKSMIWAPDQPRDDLEDAA